MLGLTPAALIGIYEDEITQALCSLDDRVTKFENNQFQSKILKQYTKINRVELEFAGLCYDISTNGHSDGRYGNSTRAFWYSKREYEGR